MTTRVALHLVNLQVFFLCLYYSIVHSTGTTGVLTLAFYWRVQLRHGPVRMGTCFKNAVVKSLDVPICNFLAICRELVLLVDFLSLVSSWLLENPKGNP